MRAAIIKVVRVASLVTVASLALVVGPGGLQAQAIDSADPRSDTERDRRRPLTRRDWPDVSEQARLAYAAEHAEMMAPTYGYDIGSEERLNAVAKGLVACIHGFYLTDTTHALGTAAYRCWKHHMSIDGFIPEDQLAWHEGGTLLTLTTKDWKRATPRNRLATAAAMILHRLELVTGESYRVETWRQQDLDDLRGLSEILVACMDSAVAGDDSGVWAAASPCWSRLTAAD